MSKRKSSKKESCYDPSQFNRLTNVGLALTKALDSLLEENIITSDDYQKVIDNFDKIYPKEIQSVLERNQGDDLEIKLNVCIFSIIVSYYNM